MIRADKRIINKETYGAFLIPVIMMVATIFTPPCHASSISQQPQDVQAAVEWLPANLANTPIAPTFTPMVVELDQPISVGGASNTLRIDLPVKGNRLIISGSNHSSGNAFLDPVDVELDSINNRLIVLNQGTNELIAVDAVTGSHTILSSSSVGSGPVFSNPGISVLDTLNNHKGGCHG